MKYLKISIAFELILYRTMILQEITRISSEYFYYIFLVLNEIQVLKYTLLIFIDGQHRYKDFINILMYLARPTYYLNKILEEIYQCIIFCFIQLFLIIWINLVLKKGFTSKENYALIMQQYQSASTINFLIIQVWKFIYIILTDFFGFLIIEGSLTIIQDKNQNDLTSLILGTIILIEILIIIFTQEIFFSISMHYIPNQLNQQIQTSFLSILQKFIKITIMSVFISDASFKQIFVIIASFVYSVLELYIQLYVRVKLDNKMLKISSFMQCLILCVSLQQFFNYFFDKENKQQYSLQFTWLILSVLCQFSINQMINKENFELIIKRASNCKQNLHNKDLIFYKQKLLSYQNLNLRKSPEYEVVNQCLLYHHKQQCNKQLCFCKNAEMVMIKLESTIVKDIIENFRIILSKSQYQSSFFYIQFIQLLIIQDKCFEALSWTQKILNSLHQQSFHQRSFQYLRGQISIQHKNLYKLIYQQILINISSTIQVRQTENQKNQHIQKAIESLQQKINQQKGIQDQFEEILMLKIGFLEKIYNNSQISPSIFEIQTHQIIEKIEQQKQLLQHNFSQVPTSNNQCLLLFYQVEILNDLINSQTISGMSSQLNEYDQKNDANSMIDYLSQEFHCYTLALMDEDNIVIQPNLNKNQKLSPLKYNNFEDMIPNSLLQIHKFYVRDFFQNGRNRFYLNINESFLQITTGVITPIDLCMNVQFDLIQNRLLSLAFIRLEYKNTSSHFIILDQHFRIKEMTQNLYQNFIDKYLNQRQMFFDQKIFIFIPQLNEGHFKEDKNIGIFELGFMKSESQSYHNSKQPHQIGDKSFGTLFVKIRKNNQKFIYYILQISDIRSEKKEWQGNNISPQTDFDEKEFINIPNENQIQFDINEVISNQPIQLLSSRLDAQLPLLFTSLGDGIEKIMPQDDIIKDCQSQASNQSQKEDSCKRQVQDDQEQDFEDQGSQISSVAAVKKSLYYKQFFVINKLIFSHKFPTNLKKFNFLFILFIGIAMINLVLLINEVQELLVYQSLLSLLSIKYDIYEPIQSFLNTRYTIVSLNQALMTKIINQTDFNYLTVFPKSNLVKGYDDLKGNILDVLTRKEFQSFLKDKYFESYWYESTFKSVQRNITFRTGILALLEYQYDFKLAYTVKSIVVDGSYFYYSYKNYIALINIFTDLNDDILNQIISKLDSQSSKLSLITLPSTIISVIITIMYSGYMISQRKIKNKILNLALYQDQDILINEVKRLNQLKALLYGDENYFYKYTLDVSNYDNQLKNYEKEYSKFINKKGNKLGIKKQAAISLINFLQLLIIFFNLAMLQAIYSVTLGEFNSYLRRFSNTAVIYESLSSTGVDILIIYSEREVLYRRANIAFFKQQDVDDLDQLIDKSLIAIKSFNQELSLVNQEDYLLDDNSMQLFNDVNKNSLCKYLPDEYQNYSTTLCPQVLLGVLNFGLQSTLNLMYNSIFSEKQINNFTVRNNSQVPVRELEGPTFTAKVIKKLVQTLNLNISAFTDKIRINFTVVFAIAICFEILIGFVIIFKFSYYENKQINNLRKIVYLLPKSTLLFDDSYQRQIKNIIQIGDLI